MNRRHTLLVLIVSTIFVGSAFAQMRYFRHSDLPNSAKQLLTARFGHWELFQNVVPYFDPTRTHVGWEYTDVIKGDFNYDRRQDYAALVRLSDSSSRQTGFLVVFLGASSSFDLQIADTLEYKTDLVLFLQHKGTVLEDYETNQELRLPVDGIFLAIYEKAGWTYYYDKHGGRHKLQSSD